jgi:hypothetical protein
MLSDTHGRTSIKADVAGWQPSAEDRGLTPAGEHYWIEGDIEAFIAEINLCALETTLPLAEIDEGVALDADPPNATPL